jgi:hypothetical protein
MKVALNTIKIFTFHFLSSLTIVCVRLSALQNIIDRDNAALLIQRDFDILCMTHQYISCLQSNVIEREIMLLCLFEETGTSSV